MAAGSEKRWPAGCKKYPAIPSRATVLPIYLFFEESYANFCLFYYSVLPYISQKKIKKVLGRPEPTAKGPYMVYWTGTTALEGNDGHRREKQDHRAVCTLPQRAHACGKPAERPAGVAFGARGGGPHGPAHGGPRPGPHLAGAGGPIGGRPALFGI